MAVVNRISEHEYRELALAEDGRLAELWNGVPQEKPTMSMAHADVSFYLGMALGSQLDRSEFRVNVNDGKLRVSGRNYLIPDVVVIPATYKIPFRRDPRASNTFAQPMPLVVEVWSRTTGHYGYGVKLHAYRERGDELIWYIHPFERTLTAWRRQPDGSYVETLIRGGNVPVASLACVSIDLESLFEA